MTAESINAYKTATDNFLKQLAMFNQQQFNAIPFEGSWTPAQVADHMLKSQVGMPQIFTGNTKPADRKPDANYVMVESVFLNFDHKMKSPAFILPTDAPQDKEEVLSQYRGISEEIQETSGPLDGTEICLDFALPNAGTLTRQEWLHFVACHTIRHTRQLENIRQQMNS